MIEEHDRVVLKIGLPEVGLEVGDVGVVVHIYPNHEAYEVEFMAGGGRTLAVETLRANEVRRQLRDEVLHVRSVEPIMSSTED